MTRNLLRNRRFWMAGSAIVVAGILLLAWPDGAEYPEAPVVEFVANCREATGSSADQCKCFVDHVESFMTFDEFERRQSRFLDSVESGGVVPENLIDPALDCGIIGID